MPSFCPPLSIVSRRHSDGIRLKRFTQGWSTNPFPKKAKAILAVKSVKGVYRTFSQMKMDANHPNKTTKQTQIYSSGMLRG